ncbi:MAG: regulatory protein GemA [Paenibacillus macerans]|uniref:regulatory protein GemA n=1 Tax=Paenibacillus macerans TaxID=44252 RepID=UPI001F0FB71F|nr:regulatory protein GemA [Paenibacillus macerans]MDU7473597.1 regulatory protein GemA [Paenibacillus macerans]MEC0139181.1 regulatory protein GemA [Paenibacillus macerans]UMV47262.1 regulatory protein GemA [Paenibacillus macerans]
MSRAGLEKRTPEQNRKIWALAGELGFDEGLLRDVVERLTGQRSTSALTVVQANRLIDELNRIAGKPQPSTTSTRRPGMATPEQLHKIRTLERDLGWADNPKRLQAFMKKYCGGVARLEWLQFGQATTLIESLKGVLRSEQNRHHG